MFGDLKNLTEYDVLLEWQQLIVRFNMEELKERLVDKVKNIYVNEKNFDVLFSVAEGDFIPLFASLKRFCFQIICNISEK